MQEFSYYNIFETKGIEYILTIVFFAILIPFWLVINKQVQIVPQIQRAFGVLTANILKIPKGIFYNKKHTWAFMEKSGIARVGIDDLLPHLTGTCQVTFSKEPGDLIKKGETMTLINHKGKKLRILAPISGKIVQSNQNLNKNPEILSSDPYSKGWIYGIEPTNWVEDTKSCIFAEDAVKWAANELDRFKDFLTSSLQKHTPELSMVALQDGGELRDQTLSELPDPVWDDFQREFLD